MEERVAHGEAANKATLRRTFTTRLAAFGPDERARESEALVAHLKNWAKSAHEGWLLGTLPLDGEPDLLPFYDWWLSNGRELALARTGPKRNLQFHRVETLNGPWEEKSWGLREPPSSAPCWEPGPASLCLVPGLAFSWSAQGATRLGRGGGYYDRWLSDHRGDVLTLGVGFSVQEAAELPREAHDQGLDGLLLAGSNPRWARGSV